MENNDKTLLRGSKFFLYSTKHQTILLAFHVTLVDEIYDDYNLDELLEDASEAVFSNQFFCAVINGSDFSGLRHVGLDNFNNINFPSTFPEQRMSSLWIEGSINRVYLRKLYRNPFQISKLCAKLRRQLDFNSDVCSDISSLPWAMSIDNGLDVHCRKQSILFLSRKRFNYINAESLEGKSIAMVEIGSEEKLTEYFPSVSGTFFQVHNLEKAEAAELEFTGVEFEVVCLLFGFIGPDPTHLDEKVNLILYNAISRSTDSVIVLFHEKDWELFEQLEKFCGMDLVLDKLSKSKLMTETKFEPIDSPSRMMQAIKTIIVNKDLPQFKTLLPLVAKLKGADFYQSVQNLLASCFTWCKKGNILEMLRLFLSETRTEMSDNDAWKHLCQSLHFVDGDWNQTLRQKLLVKFLEVTQLSFNNLNFETDVVEIETSIESNCWIAESQCLLQALRNSQPSEIIFEFIAGMVSFHFNENFFQKITANLFEGRKIRIDAESTMEAFSVRIVQEENFLTIINLLQNDVLQLITEISEKTKIPLIFVYFQWHSFDKFKFFFTRIRQANISLSKILDHQKSNILWHTGCGDCGVQKVRHVLEDASKQSNGELETLLTHRNNKGESALRYNCLHANDPEVVIVLLQLAERFWGNDICEYGRTLIHAACLCNQIAVSHFLLSLDKQNNYGVTKMADKDGRLCLHSACMEGNTTIVEMLLEVVPELTSKADNHRCNAFQDACAGGHLEVAQMLYKHYCEEISTARKKILIAVNEDGCIRGNKHLAEWLLDQNQNLLKTVDENGNSILHLAVMSGNLELVKWIVNLDRSLLYSLNNQKSNSLHVACIEGHKHLAEWFLSQDQNLLKTVKENGNSILHLAVMSGNLELVKWIVNLDRSLLYSLNNQKSNSLHVACIEGHKHLAEWFLSQDQNLLKTVDEDGNSILHLAVMSGNLELVKWIVNLDRSLLYSLNNQKSNSLHVA